MVAEPKKFVYKWDRLGRWTQCNKLCQGKTCPLWRHATLNGEKRGEALRYTTTKNILHTIVPSFFINVFSQVFHVCAKFTNSTLRPKLRINDVVNWFFVLCFGNFSSLNSCKEARDISFSSNYVTTSSSVRCLRLASSDRSKFLAFSKKKSDDVVEPFFTWNNPFNLNDEHSDSIEKNRNMFYSILCILLIQICEC